MNRSTAPRQESTLRLPPRMRSGATLASALLIAASMLMIAPSRARAAAGDLDATFGEGGTVMSATSPRQGWGAALQPDGKIVVVGNAGDPSNLDFVVARYNPDGTVDDSFGVDGEVTTHIGAIADEAYAVALQPDGKIVVAGQSYDSGGYDFALARYDSEGVPDDTFDGDGVVTTSFTPNHDGANAVLIQPDGKIVAAGTAGFNTGSVSFAVARYNEDGSPDDTFDGDGKTITNLGIYSFGYAAVLQGDGKIVVGGDVLVQALSPFRFGLARFDAGGALDPTFDGDGKVVTSFASDAGINALALEPEGKVVAAGLTDNGSNLDFAFARYLVDGTPDPAFSADGKRTLSFAPGTEDATIAVRIQDDGRIVAAGVSGGTTVSFALARLFPDGSVDPTFGSSQGTLTTQIGENSQANAVLLQPDGKILAVGVASDGVADHFALARYEPHSFADLAITLMAIPSPVLAGEQVVYSMHITSGGPEAAQRVVVELQDPSTGALPAGSAYVSGTWTTSEGFAGTCTEATLVTCAILFIHAGETAEVTITLATEATAFPSGGSLEVEASVSAAEEDPSPSDNEATETITVKRRIYRPDALIKARSDARFLGNNIYNTTGKYQTRVLNGTRGSTRYFTIKIQNDGNGRESFRLSSTMSGAGVRFTFFRGTTPITHAVTHGTYQATLSPGRSITIRLIFKVTNQASYGSRQLMQLKVEAVSKPTAKDTVKAFVRVLLP
jgi:uncharacterized delta-60 repeat protein